jgi:glyoxylase-like metal-dependent hydrolase (beta-lactamase superfamily II)
MKLLLALAALLAAAPDPAPEIIPGGIHGQEPDGNTIVFEAEGGLVIVDTGRHREHQAKILALASARGKPIAAIVNTHWHLDHSGGNQEIRAAFPEAKLYTSNAVRGALDGFLARAAEGARARLARPGVTQAEKDAVALFLEALDHRKDLIPDMPVTGDIKLGRLELHLAPFAATEGDVWLYDPASGTLVAGDLVVLPVPFFDTACAMGWRSALDRIAAQRFDRLVPGHGPALTRAQFEKYRFAFDNLVDCAAGTAPKLACIAGWERDAAPFLTREEDRKYAREALDYYIDRVLRAGDKAKELCGTAG